MTCDACRTPDTELFTYKLWYRHAAEPTYDLVQICRQCYFQYELEAFQGGPHQSPRHE